MNMKTRLLKQKALLAAEKLRREESPDYCRGFDDACWLLVGYMKRLKKEVNCLLKSPPTK